MLTAYAASTANDVADGTVSQLGQLIELVLTRIPLWIAAFVVVVITMFVARIGRSIVENKLAEKGIEEEHKEIQILGGRMTYSGILVLGLTIGLKIAGIDLTTILAAVAFGIGFALKDLIMNFLAGIMILVGRHFTLGDFISIGGTLGKVVEIQSRVTIIQATDGTKVIVPNSELFKKQVTSFTSNPFRRIEVIVGVDYRTNLENALRICMRAIKTTDGVLLEPKPNVVIGDFGESSVDLKLRAWVDSRSGWVKIRSELILKVKKDFDEHGIVIPWPIRSIAYDKDFAHQEKMMEEKELPKHENQVVNLPVVSVVSATPVVSASPVTPAVPPAPEASDSGNEQPLKPLGEII